MSLPVVFRRNARFEFDEAADWYEGRRPGLGVRFVAAVEHVLEQASENPWRYAEIRKDVHEGLVRGFPYGVYYRAESEQIVVLAIFHASRDPSIWQSRI